MSKMSVDTGYLTTQVNNIIGQLHGIFDAIGVPSHERETRETEVRTIRSLGNILSSRTLTSSLIALCGPVRYTEQSSAPG